MEHLDGCFQLKSVKRGKIGSSEKHRFFTAHPLPSLKNWPIEPPLQEPYVSLSFLVIHYAKFHRSHNNWHYSTQSLILTFSKRPTEAILWFLFQTMNSNLNFLNTENVTMKSKIISYILVA